MPSDVPGLGLHGRRHECDMLDGLLTTARQGRSGVVVVRGEAGIGKTALLDYVSERAQDCRIVRTTGVESEMELAFAGLHQLCALMLDRLPHLPTPQREALSTAFGMSSGKPPDCFLVGLAVLSLLAEVAEDQCLVCVVDDAQWLDPVSAQMMAFVARRLLAERVVMVFAVRRTSDGDAFSGLGELSVGGLADVPARALLDSVIRAPLDEQIRQRIVAETAGNPLALLELPRGMTPAQLAGGFGLPDTMPIANRIEQGFIRRLKPLAADTRRLLLTAAAEPVGDASLLWRALANFGIGIEAVAPAQAAGLIEDGAQIRFRHPLVRSAVFRAAAARDLQDVHRALADVTDSQLDPDRRAWHRARAAVGPNESVARELEQSADRARARGGVAAAGAFLRRATELTPDAALRGARALAAAQATFDAAAPETALELLAVAELCPLDSLARAKVERLRAELSFALGHPHDAPKLLLDTARQLEPLDAELSRDTYLEVLGAGTFAGRLALDGWLSDAADACS